MGSIPTSLDDVLSMIQNGTQESIHLDYKASPALSGKTEEICKDVSAFANSDGGILIYGVEERDHLPLRIDDGVDHNKYTREWLENIVHGNVARNSPTSTVLRS